MKIEFFRSKHHFIRKVIEILVFSLDFKTFLRFKLMFDVIRDDYVVNITRN